MKKILKRFKLVQRLVSLIDYFGIYTVGNRKNTKNNIEKWLKVYEMDGIKKKQLKKLRIDILYSMRRYGIKPHDYFFFDFIHKSDSGRKAYIGSQTWSNLTKRLSTDEAEAVFKNKYSCYLKFQPYFKREAVLIKSKEDRAAFLDFCGKHGKFIVKPLAGMQGQGVRLIEVSEFESDDALFQEVLGMGESIAEELIVQTRDMARLHPESVNTVRAVTIYWAGEVHLLYTSMRIGEGDSIVDNIGSGGLCVAVDTESGIISSKAVRENPNEGVLIHPQTGEQIIGTKLPEWNELLELVDKLARVVPEHQIVGWDLAHTEKGWVIVEGNTNPAIYLGQMPAGCGFRTKVERIVGKL